MTSGCSRSGRGRRGAVPRIDAAYERRSIAISSNIHPGGFDELLPTTIASAGVDRFMHHAHVVVTEGDSYRFAGARDGKVVTPLT